MVYLAKVSDAVSANRNPKSTLDWFKISEKGLKNGVRAVDELIANEGWYNFTMPSCVPPSQYLMRVEILALHSAFAPDGAQFYVECVQSDDITSFLSHSRCSPNNLSGLVKFPGAYSAMDPSVLLSIYDDNGQPTNGGKPYTIPGPKVLSCN
ncbi:putative endo-beta-1,4-glucanase D [Colletotrichum spaethianum]|uniref:lytic cellulose monooxygenase (C4-dehydrogenating) n=1 Tax=Colletotrichum spaethianum TaxID=700344 RepID=A0AA37LDK3_9PEZI|nr:putative endo-beta-1,4-glucanase D [Colletotrichum spaethianum]GKT44564.1 putative endo-beta-1,4-glucanase D [Colletotrichum spaethianum]